MRITKDEAKERYQSILEEINVIGNAYDVECIRYHILELWADGAWHHGKIASRKLKDKLDGKHFNLDVEIPGG